MGFLVGEDIEDACQEVYGTEGYKSHWSEELVGDAAAAEAVKAYETLSESRGKPSSYPIAKEIMAGFANAETDQLFEVKGLDILDKEKVKYLAEKVATAAISEDNY